MPQFSEVFSTTWKVLLALFVLSVGLGLVYLVIIGIGAASHSSTRNDESLTPYYIKSADEKHTKLPQSKWNMIIDAAAKQHCPIEGMSKQEAQNALGTPSKILANGNTWQYERTLQKDCVKYSGDACVERETAHETSTLYFTPNGYMLYPGRDVPGGDQGGWLHSNCFAKPFYPRYYNLLPK
jgi:hypothetical protein